MYLPIVAQLPSYPLTWSNRRVHASLVLCPMAQYENMKMTLSSFLSIFISDPCTSASCHFVIAEVTKPNITPPSKGSLSITQKLVCRSTCPKSSAICTILNGSSSSHVCIPLPLNSRSKMLDQSSVMHQRPAYLQFIFFRIYRFEGLSEWRRGRRK